MSGGLSVASHRKGRPRSELTLEIERVALEELRAHNPQTARHVFYRLATIGLIPKSEAGYNKLLLATRRLREEGRVPWGWIADNTRVAFRPRTWDGVSGLLEDSARLYRADLMRQQPVAVQVWAESDSIGSVIANVTDEYTIPTFVGRGFSSRGHLWRAAQDAHAAHRAGKDVVIFHVGDYDPSGEAISRDVEQTLRLYALTVAWDRNSRASGHAPVSVADVRRTLLEEGEEAEYWTDWLRFERLALTAAQVRQYGLPMKPVKTSDTRSRSWGGTGTVEIEALPVETLLGLVDEAIRANIDKRAFDAALMAEQSEREIAERIAGTPLDRLLEAS